MKSVIYVDVLIIINFIINCLILKLSALLSQVSYKTWRLILSGFLLAFASLIILLPPLHTFFLMFLKLFLSIIMTFVAYGFISVKRFLKVLAFFYLTNFILAGLMSVIWYLICPNGMYFNNQSLYLDINIFTLFLLVCVSYFIIYLFKFLTRNSYKQSEIAVLTIDANGMRVSLKAFLDTGNNLTDPLSGRSVLICDYNHIQNLFQGKLKTIIEKENEYSITNIITKIPTEIQRIYKFRLVTYKTITNDGLILAFIPEKVKITTKTDELYAENIIIGIVFKELSSEYQALLNPDLVTYKTKHKKINN